MTALQEDIDDLIDQLVDDDNLVTVFPDTSSSGYRIQRTLLATVSQRLAEQCYEEDSTLLHMNDDAFRIFLGWLPCRSITRGNHKQLELAMAWNFGRKYEMPEFQNEVMKVLFEEVETDEVYAHAIHQAYRIKRDTPLKRLFVAQLAIDICLEDTSEWSKEVFAHYGIDNVPDFLLHVSQAVPQVDWDDPYRVKSRLQVEDFLLGIMQRVN